MRARIHAAFEHIDGATDFGFAMHDAVRTDLPTTLRRYREFHADWQSRVAVEARFLSALRPDLALTDVAYLPLAGAAHAYIPAWSMCSLNWAGLFGYFFGNDGSTKRIHEEILAAYRSAERFLRLTPALPMPELPNAQDLAPVAGLGTPRRAELGKTLALAGDERLVLIAYGGFDRDLGAAAWPHLPGLRWLVPRQWGIRRRDMHDLESLGLPFADLLASVDAVLTKPGYGTFVEAAGNGIPVLYQRREDWPEQDYLIDWLEGNGRCREIAAAALARGQAADSLEALWRQPVPPRPALAGAGQAACLLRTRLLPDHG